MKKSKPKHKEPSRVKSQAKHENVDSKSTKSTTTVSRSRNQPAQPAKVQPGRKVGAPTTTKIESDGWHYNEQAGRWMTWAEMDALRRQGRETPSLLPARARGPAKAREKAPSVALATSVVAEAIKAANGRPEALDASEGYYAGLRSRLDAAGIKAPVTLDQVQQGWRLYKEAQLAVA